MDSILHLSTLFKIFFYPLKVLFDTFRNFSNLHVEELNDVLNESFLIEVLRVLVCIYTIVRLLGVIRRQNEPADPPLDPAAADPPPEPAAVCRFCGTEYCAVCEEVFKASRWDEFMRNHSIVLAGYIENEEPIREFFKGVNPSFVVRFSTQSYYNYGLHEEVFSTVVTVRNYALTKSAEKQG